MCCSQDDPEVFLADHRGVVLVAATRLSVTAERLEGLVPAATARLEGLLAGAQSLMGTTTSFDSLQESLGQP